MITTTNHETSPNLWAQEEYVNATKGWRAGSSDIYETFATSTGELYRAMAREYGRCTGKVYIDAPGSPQPQHIGWVFVKRAQYSDCKETYLQECWVTTHDRPASRTIEYHYHAMEA